MIGNPSSAKEEIFGIQEITNRRFFRSTFFINPAAPATARVRLRSRKFETKMFYLSSPQRDHYCTKTRKIKTEVVKKSGLNTVRNKNVTAWRSGVKHNEKVGRI